jgi:ComF family protein
MSTFLILKYACTQARMLFMPPRCVHCKLLLSEIALFCVACAQKITPIVSSTLTITGTRNARVFAISAYQEPLKSLILAKSRGDRIASRELGELIFDYTPIRVLPVDFFIPIPLHWTRFAYRGFNQAAEIAQVLSAKHGAPVLHALKRVKRTQYQSQVSHDQRAGNVADSFEWASLQKNLEGRHLVLVDDVLTTGSTVRAAARVLLEAKPASITVVVACRVV